MALRLAGRSIVRVAIPSGSTSKRMYSSLTGFLHRIGARRMGLPSPTAKPTEARMNDVTLPRARFPGETQEYRRARDALLQSEIELRRHMEAVAAERRALPP